MIFIGLLVDGLLDKETSVFNLFLFGCHKSFAWPAESESVEHGDLL